MKRIDIFKQLLMVVAMGASVSASAQKKAISYPAHTLSGGTTATVSNYYADYVGVRLEVLDPAAVAGDKDYKTTNSGAGVTGDWAGVVTTPIINVPIVMITDSLVTSVIPVGSMTGKIAVIYRGGGIEFGYKADQCFNAGAIGCIIVNNVSGGPVGMAAGTYGTLIPTTSGFPVFMISKADGDALGVQYHLGNIPNITVTPWGQSLTNDLGFIPGGLASAHSYAVPFDQMTSAATSAYMGADGAFIGNFGSADQTGVTVTSTLSFTPNSGSATTLHTSSVSLASFPAADSIYAMVDTSASSTNVYGVTAPSAGRFDLTYNITSSATDEYVGDNTASVSYYASDSVYSAGRYDFTNNKPFINSGTRPGGTTAPEFLWGPMYYVNKGGAALSKAQYTLYSTTTSVPPLLDAIFNNAYLYKWVDGFGGLAKDGIIQDGELKLMAIGTKTYDVSGSSADTSGALLTINNFSTDTAGGNPAMYYTLEDTSWYYMAVDVPATYSLGIDGINSGYPRVFSRFYNKSSEFEYNNLLIGITSDRTDLYNGNIADANAPQPFIQTAFIGSVDSFSYTQSKGIIPQVPMTVNKNPTVVDTNVGVNNVVSPIISATLFPNPAANYLTVSLDLAKVSPVVTYTIIDGLARFVSKDVVTNVKSDTHTVNTAKLAPGNYYMIINANDRVISRKFTIVK